MYKKIRTPIFYLFVFVTSSMESGCSYIWYDDDTDTVRWISPFATRHLKDINDLSKGEKFELSKDILKTTIQKEKEITQLSQELKDIRNNKEITLNEALANVGKSLESLQEAQGSNKSGLLPSEIEVTFSIASSESQNGGLVVDLSAPSASPFGSLSVKGNQNDATETKKSNTVTIKFSNVLSLLGKNINITSPSDLCELYETLRKQGINILPNNNLPCDIGK